ncbi:unknow [Vibrio parahaemolyticus]|nr:unknow [Vibrio parahaemolyticus]
MAGLNGSKRGKGKSTEAFEFAVSLQLWVSRVQNLLCC